MAIPRGKRVVIGGTFDVLHKGHIALIEKAFASGERVLIGVTTDDYAGMIHRRRVKEYGDRLQRLMSFLRDRGLINRADIFPIQDHFGPTLEMREIDSLVVSEESLPRARDINAKRRERGLHPLEVIIIDTVLAEDGKAISSTRIRRGEIDEEGRLLR